jgi:predicted metalloprotease with PDZ domain
VSIAPFRLAFILAILFFSCSSLCAAQPSPAYSCRVTRIEPGTRSLTVRCALTALHNRVEIGFRDRFAGMTDLSARITSFDVSEENGSRLAAENLGSGRYAIKVSEAELGRSIVFSYRMNLAAPLEPGQYALASSLGPDAAVLYAADLFPELAESGLRPKSIEVSPPEGWRLTTVGTAGEMADWDNQVYFLGRLRERAFEIRNMRLRLAITGTWPFADDEIARLAETIARVQAGMIEGQAKGDYLLALAPFPLPLMGLRSAGLARGRSVTLVLNPNENAAQTRVHLARHLAHEMFHFYLPNAFSVRENFDWFWEGFTRYVALATLLEGRLITISEYLDALQNEDEAYGVNPLRTRLSLAAASPEKFATPAHYEIVYRKGLLVAALYDLELRWQSRARSKLTEIIKMLYRDYALTAREIGHREVVEALGRAGNFATFIADYIEGVREIELVRQLKPYGIEVDRQASRGRVRLIVSTKLNPRQRALFDSLEGR